MSDFTRELESLIKRHCKENDSNTPDFILAKYMEGCLRVYNETVTERDKWYGFSPFSSSRNLRSS